MKKLRLYTRFKFRKDKTFCTVFLSLVMALNLISSNALAANITVDNGGDGNIGCTLRAAVASINTITLAADCNQTGPSFGNDDQIDFSVSIVNLSDGEIDIDKDISINGGPSGVTINGDGNSRIFNLDENPTSITLNNLTLSGGNADQGGAIYASRVVLSLNQSVITGNTASINGGGIYAGPITTVNMQESTLSNNFANQGGGIYAKNSTVNLTDSAISNNTADVLNSNGRGGGLWLEISNLNFMSSHLSNNAAGLEGGGLIAFNNSTIVFNESTVSGNNAQINGGISTLSNVNLTLNNSTVSGNKAERTTSGGNVDTGGGMGIITSTVTLNNSTISGNISGFTGGAIVLRTSELISNNSTIAYNFSGNSALSSAVYIENNSTATFNNTIVSNAGNGCLMHGNPSVVEADADNIIQTDACNTSALNINPDLAPLAFNGGKTKNHGLYIGSLAIDTANDTKCMDVATINNLDQRGMVRPKGSHCDIGSFEGMLERSSGTFFIIPTKNGKAAIVNF